MPSSEQNAERWRALWPLAAPAAVFALFRLFHDVVYHDEIKLVPGWLAGVDGFEVVAESFVARTQWGLSSVVFTAVSLAALVGLPILSWRSLEGRSAKWRGLWLGTAAVLAVGVGARTVVSGDVLSVPALVPILEVAFAELEIPEGSLLLRLYLAFCLGAAVLLASVACAVLCRRPRETETQEHLHRQLKRLRLALYLGAGVLVAAVIEVSAMHRLPSALLDEASRDTYWRVVQVVSASQGLLWTLILLAIYLPAFAVLRARAFRLASKQGRPAGAEKPGPEEPEKAAGTGKEDDFLAEWSLATRPLQQIARVGVMLAPFLLGGPGAEILELLLGR